LISAVQIDYLTQVRKSSITGYMPSSVQPGLSPLACLHLPYRSLTVRISLYALANSMLLINNSEFSPTNKPMRIYNAYL